MARPLIVSDCDGVLLDFIDPFTAYLQATHQLTLSLESFALSGNIRRADGSTVEASAFPALLGGFFDSHMPTQTAVPGAAEALAELAMTCDVVILTNIAEKHALKRTGELARRGMPYRVIGNNGPKGVPLKALVDHFKPTRAVFIDDLPPHHSSARKTVPEVHRLHMVAEPVLQSLIPAALDADARIDDWTTALAHIRAVLEETR